MAYSEPGPGSITRCRVDSVELSGSFHVWIEVETPRNGSKAKVCRFGGTAPVIFGLVSSGLGADLGPTSMTSIRILESFRALVAQPNEVRSLGNLHTRP